MLSTLSESTCIVYCNFGNNIKKVKNIFSLSLSLTLSPTSSAVCYFGISLRFEKLINGIKQHAKKRKKLHGVNLI